MSDSTPSGWYEDPYGAPDLLRWWDGRQWTDATEPAQRTSPEPVYGQVPGPLYGPPPGPAYTPPGPEPYASARRDGRGALPWLLPIGAGLVVIVVVVVVTVSVLSGHGGGPAASSGSPAPTGPATSAPAPAGTRSAVIGTITDSRAGISYDRLGSPWTAADSGWLGPNLFTAGQVAVVQAPFEQYASFNATNLSGVPRPAEAAGYTGPNDLSTVGRRVTSRILTEHFAMAKTQATIVSGARTVDGHQAWLEKFRLDFTDAVTKGWKFRADTVAVLVADTGGGHLAELWVSVPDTFAGQGDVDQVLESVKIS